MKTFSHFIYFLFLSVTIIAQNTLQVLPDTRLIDNNTGPSLSLVYTGGTLTNQGIFSLGNSHLKLTGDTDLSGGDISLKQLQILNGITSIAAMSEISINEEVNIFLAGTLQAGADNITLGNQAFLVNNGLLTGTLLGLRIEATQTFILAPQTATLSHNVSGSSMLYQWQISPDGVNDWADISMANSPSYVTGLPGFFRARLTASNTNYDQFTPVQQIMGCLDLSSAIPGEVIIDNGICGPSCEPVGASISAPTIGCPPNSSVQYSVNNGTWSTSLPIYADALTIKTRCVCDDEDTIFGPESTGVVTSAAACTDITPPSIICPSIQTLVLEGNCTAELPDYTEMAAIGDNCGILDVTQSPIAGTMVSDVGNITVTLTITDVNSNVNSCSFTVNKVDNTNPIITCFNQTLVFNGETSISLNSEDLVDADDSCGLGDVVLNISAINCSQIGQIIPIMVTVTDVNNNTSTCTSQITVEGLPCGWTQDPNGINCSEGNSIGYNPSTQTWTANSTNCFSGNPFNSDAMAFAQQTLCGNGSITAQVTGITGTALGWAGVSMREDNSGGAKKAQLMTNLSTFSRREFRTTTGGSAIPQQFLSPNRYWLRIVRSGNQFSLHVSADGVNWFFSGAQNIMMPSCIESGLVVTNYSSNSTVSATFSNVTIVGSNQTLTAGDHLSSDQHNLRTSEVAIYPNPGQTEAWIELADYEGEEVSISIRDINGRIIFHQGAHQLGSSRQRIDLSVMTSGVYLVEIDRAGYRKSIERLVVIGKR